MTVKALKRQMMAAVAMVMVAAIALASSTYAWFVSNNSVSAAMSNVTAASSSTNLMIVSNTGVNTKTITGGGFTASTTLGEIALYPSSLSTVDLPINTVDQDTQWHVVSSWTDDRGTAAASSYAAVSIDKPVLGAGAYTVGDNNIYNAYAIASYTVYTANGTADLYLDNSTSPAIAVSLVDEDSNQDKNAMLAMRVGIAVDGVMKLVYAPYAEIAANGNDSSYTTENSNYKSVLGESAAGDAPYPVVAGVQGVLASGNTNPLQAVGTTNIYSAFKNADGSFSTPTAALTSVAGAGATPLATAVGSDITTAALVEVYVWLEGTDSDCMIDPIAGDPNNYNISVNFAGVQSTP